MKERIRKIISFGKDFGRGLGERNLAMYAAAGTYKIFMSIVPVLMLIVSLVQFLPITQEQINEMLRGMLPEQVMTVVEKVVAGIYSGGKAAFTISIVLTVWSASGSMRQIMKGIDAAYNCSDVKQNTLLYYARSILYMIGFVLVLLVSLLIMAYGGSILDLLLKTIPKLSNLTILFGILKVARYFVIFALLYFVFLAMYRFVPKKKVRAKDQRPGALFSAVAWVLFSLVFSVYISYSNKFGAYGIIGTVMVAMMWLYYNIFFLLIGGWLNSFLTDRKEPPRDCEAENAAAEPEGT